MSHDLLIAKLCAYGLNSSATNVILDYLKNRKQRTRVGTKYSDWCGIDTGVPQGSILGPLLFNIHICDLFYFLSDKKAVNYADDTTRCAVGNTWEEVKQKLISSTEIIFTWLPINQMIGNANKYQLITNQKNNIVSQDWESLSSKPRNRQDS